MAIPWGTIKSLLIFFAPILLPRALALYRRATTPPPRPTNNPAPSLPLLRAILLLLLTTLFLALPSFPRSRKHLHQNPIPPANTRRPDYALRAKFASLESRLLYLQYGPETVGTCPFCTSDEPRAYLYYALPELLAPYLNTVLRDEELRGRGNAYWAHEVRLMREMMEEREVIEGVNDALQNRIDIRGVERDAEAYAKAVLMPEEVVGLSFLFSLHYPRIPSTATLFSRKLAHKSASDSLADTGVGSEKKSLLSAGELGVRWKDDSGEVGGGGGAWACKPGFLALFVTPGEEAGHHLEDLEFLGVGRSRERNWRKWLDTSCL
ncbi:hypothetical protein N0V88_000540 [Collariella sp. IMI 366227]|nr:hypothetical protein N0V88_000540 [Collariella sp. IMI 366227]